MSDVPPPPTLPAAGDVEAARARLRPEDEHVLDSTIAVERVAQLRAGIGEKLKNMPTRQPFEPGGSGFAEGGGASLAGQHNDGGQSGYPGTAPSATCCRQSIDQDGLSSERSCPTRLGCRRR